MTEVIIALLSLAVQFLILDLIGQVKQLNSNVVDIKNEITDKQCQHIVHNINNDQGSL